SNTNILDSTIELPKIAVTHAMLLIWLFSNAFLLVQVNEFPYRATYPSPVGIQSSKVLTTVQALRLFLSTKKAPAAARTAVTCRAARVLWRRGKGDCRLRKKGKWVWSAVESLGLF
ncbi:MAG: hypothetical protein EBZ49_14125, partial [Proteobacteria bacterium]|nr:hypothetical protein [Pseudomonadota bacterium]